MITVMDADDHRIDENKAAEKISTDPISIEKAEGRVWHLWCQRPRGVSDQLREALKK